jgi:hypothetical protein
MKRVVLAVLVANIVFAGENIYLGDTFNDRHSKPKEAYIKTMAKNRAYTGVGNGSYVEIDSKEEFKEALESGALDQKIDTNGVTKTFRAIDISNVNLNKNDLKDITEDTDRLLIGSEVDGNRESLMQNINIKNSKIETDKKLNVGVIAKDKRVKGIENYTNIDKSSLQGGKRTDKKKSRLDEFDDLDSDF